MSWGDHDIDLINQKLGYPSSRKDNNAATAPVSQSIEQEMFFKHQKDNNDNNLAYRDRDWYALGFKDGKAKKADYGYTNNFAKNLRIIRIAFGLTMDELGKQSGVTMQTIGKYEAGDTEPGISTLINLAEALNVSVSYLLTATLSLGINEQP